MPTHITKTNCALCGASSELKYKAYPGYQIPSVFDIYYCSFCNTSFSMPRCDTKGIYDLIYKNGPNVRWYDRYWRYAEAIKKQNNPMKYLTEQEDIYWAVNKSLQLISKNETKLLNILEIGCGLGYLTYSLNREGYKTFGLDISKEVIANAIQNYGNYYVCADIKEYATKHENEYDVIILTEVIEHINDIYSFMEDTRRLLTNSGKVILTTPNKSFFPNSTLWATDLPPIHIWWLSEDSLKHIAKEINMSIIFLDFSEYYSLHKTRVDLRKINIPITFPVFNNDGTLHIEVTKEFTKNNIIRKILTKLKTSLPFVKLQSLLTSSNSVLTPNTRGPVICAIFKAA